MIRATAYILENNYADFSLYFLAFNHEGRQLTEEDRLNGRYGREGKCKIALFTKPMMTASLLGILELTHNHGTESDPNFKGYANGNSDPRGFGHIAITVDNVEQACARFEKLGVPFQKKLTDGKMRNIAFILDPDGYVDSRLLAISLHI